MICDFHVHAFPDNVAQRAIDALLTTYGVPAVTDGTIAGTLAHMEKAGVDYSVVQPVATKPSQVRSINDWAAALSDARIISFGGIHPDYQDIHGEIDRIVSLGLPGIKIQGNWQEVYVDDRSMYPIYEAAEGRLIVLFHSGDELTPFDIMRATPKRIRKVHDDFAKLTIVAAHMGGYRMWDEVEEYLLGQDVYFDTSACFPADLPDERFVDMIRRHGAERILFATDLPFGDPLDDLPRLMSFGLSDGEMEHILWRNAARLLPGRVGKLES
jgi:hypothetical protein